MKGFKNNGREEFFGYYTNGIPLDKQFSIEIKPEGVIINDDKITSSNMDLDNSIWVEIDPVQCLGNSWELDWIKNNPNKEYPRGHILVIEKEEKEIIKNYYEKQGISILNIKSEEYTPDFAVCEFCSCPQGYTLYIQINKKDLQAILEQESYSENNFKLFKSPDLVCEDYTFSNCPKGCQKQCRSSDCSDGPNSACTDDCDGPKSCVNFE